MIYIYISADFVTIRSVRTFHIKLGAEYLYMCMGLWELYVRKWIYKLGRLIER